MRVLRILRFNVVHISTTVLQGVSKNNPTIKRINAEIQVILKHAPDRKRTEEKML